MTKSKGVGRGFGSGRPTKLTPELHTKFIECLRAGNYLETAAAVIGVESRNVRHWIAKGTRGLEPYRQFALDVQRVMGESETTAVAMLRAHGRKDWRALAWWLERTRPKQFGQTLAVTKAVESELDDVVEQLRSRLDPETFQRVADALDPGGEDPGSGEDVEAVH